MTTTKVLNQAAGSWSDDIMGLDKEFFVKSILTSCFHRSELYNPKSLGFAKNLKDANHLIERLELDFHSLRFNDILRVAYYKRYKDEDTCREELIEVREDGEFAEYKLSWTNINTDVSTLMVSLGILKGLMEDYKKSGQAYLVPSVEAIIKAGCVPTDAADDYALIMKFK